MSLRALFSSFGILLSSLAFSLVLFLLFVEILELAWPSLREQPGHVIVVLLFRYFNQIMTLEIFNVIIFKLIQLIVEFLMILKPKFHHRRPLSVIPVELFPSSWLIQFLNSDVVLADWLILPLKS